MMKKRKNLERAVILGVLLSTSVYGSAWAEKTYTISEFRGLGNEIPINEDTTVNGTGTSMGGDEKDNTIKDIVVTVGDGVTLNLNNLAGNNMDIKGNGNVNITLEQDAGSNGGAVYINGDIEANKLTIDTSQTSKTKGIYTYGGDVNINVNELEIKANSHGIFTTGDATSDVNILFTKNVKIETDGAHGIVNSGNSSHVNNIIIKSDIEGSIVDIFSHTAGISNNNSGGGVIDIKADTIKIGTDSLYAVRGDHGNITLDAKNNYVNGGTSGVHTWNGDIVLNASENNYITTSKESDSLGAIHTSLMENKETEKYVPGDGTIKITAHNGNNVVNATTDGVRTEGNGNVDILANGYNTIISDKNAVYNSGAGTITITASAENQDGVSALADIQDYNNNLVGGVNGIETDSTGDTNVIADNNNIVVGKENGILSNGDASINIIAGNDNVIGRYQDGTNTVTSQIGIRATKGEVNLEAGSANGIYGAIYAANKTTVIDVKGIEGKVVNNSIYSASLIDGAGDLDNKDSGGIDIVSALYAEEGAKITLSGINNIQTYYSDPNDDKTSERAVWAYNGADITIDGNTNISTSSYEASPNDMDIAIAAGTATDLDADDFKDDVLNSLEIAKVTLNYEDNGGVHSNIKGDILAAYGGEVNISAKEGLTRNTNDAGINITGNLLAGNTGKLNVDIGKNSILTGRADDYGDAGLQTGHGTGEGTENSFFNPAFSSDILTGGEVSLTMGEGSRWNVTGQSWITNLTTTQNAEDTLINLANAKEDYNTNASALTIGKLDGSTRFYMNLDGDRSASDMLYIKSANGHYDIYLQDEVTTAEINSDKAGNQFNGLRFATVGEGSNASFTVRSQGTGSAFDVEYLVGTDSYAGNDENTAYNSTTDGGANIEKPGNASVDNFFEVENSAAETKNAANEIMLMANTEETAENVTANENTSLTEVTNFKIIDRAGEKLSDTGETILNMSRANYSNAIYMDRLNKRLGEARYINGEEDQGMWVRIRHDRIGKTDAYRSQNTMYELGYDEKQECDNGMRRVGFAIDYMHGDTGYNDIAGKGEIDRYGLWLYDTWMGDKGHYVDYVAKWGHLSNDFEVYTMRDGDKVTGDYSNNVFSVSAEYGRKKDIGNDWYFEPQAQLQLARVTGADYTTNQDTKVSVDGINSLIGRAGFRLGKDFGEEKQSTVYIKADVLHEFLGDQDVYVYDNSTDNKWAGISYENEGTWYDVGIGFAAMMSKNSYAFLDLEKSFGHDNDETYQINAGMQWTF